MSDNRANLSVSWRAVAIASTTVALTSLVICAIIATINKADTLSVVALGLAVVAFTVQIMLFIVQAAAASQQSLRAQEIYGSTIRVLATIEEKTEGTQRAVSNINDRMLGALLGKAIPETASAGVSVASPEFSSAVAERVSELANQTRRSNSETKRQIPSSDIIAPSNIVRGSDKPKAYAFPEPKEVREIMPKLKGLDPQSLLSLARLGEDEARNSLIKGLPIIIGDDTLFERGLIRRIRPHWSSQPVFVLSLPMELLLQESCFRATSLVVLHQRSKIFEQKCKGKRGE
jgi:hypothetical protein